jgi:APA family basic amino acid/polyamine antiporter
MENASAERSPAQSGKLLRILGVGFGISIAIGGTVGVGILRNPGEVAGQIPSVWLIMLAWALGGVYCLLGANYLAELATSVPKAGGYYVYTHRAFGDYWGFVVGWSDWLNNTLALAFVSVVFGEYSVLLFAPNLPGGRVIFSVSILFIIAFLNMIGVRAGSDTQKITSVLKTLALIVFVVACFVFGSQNPTSSTTNAAAAALPMGLSATLVAFILAFQMVLSTYDGWYGPIYFSEEDTNPSHNLPRSLFGGIAVVTTIYLLVNIALLYVLPMSQLSGSKFAGADALSLMFGAQSGQILTILALLSLVGVINAIMMMCPRIIFALGRDGLFTRRAAAVNKGGTPVFALIVTALLSIFFTTVGSFEMLLGIGAFFIVVITILSIISLFVLRRREPDLPRPYRAWAYPYAPLLMLLFAVSLFVGYIVSNLYPSLYAIGLLVISYPIFRIVQRSQVDAEA